jgi:serine/threonine-protein kinase
LIPREIVHAEPQQLRKLDPQIPEGLERLLVRALEKDPQRRLQSADEFAVSLYAIARQLQAQQTIPVSEVSSAQATAGRAEVLAGARETHQLPLAAAVTAGATGGANSNLGITTTPAQSANPGLSIEHAASPAPAAPQSTMTAQTAMPSAQVVPQANLANSVNDVEIERQVAAPVPSPKRLVFVAAAAIGILILVAFLTHPKTNASPATVQSQANRSESTLPATQNEPSPAPALAVQEPPAPVETPAPQPQPKQILSGPVASLWEAGNYAQAMKLVDAILADDPSHPEARAWKVKIRAAQDAEASIK